MPEHPAPEIRQISGRIFRGGDALELAKKYERILIERAGLIEQQGALAAYVDKKRDRRRTPAEIGIECAIRPHRNGNGVHFQVEGSAHSINGSLTGRFNASNYEEARDCLFAMIEATGKWIDPAWFQKLLRDPADGNERRRTRQLKKAAEEKPIIRPDLAADRRGPAWRGLCRALRDLCRQRGSEIPACVVTEREVIFHLPEGRGEVRLSVAERGLLKVTPLSQEIIRMVRIRTGGCAFEFHQALHSPYRMALEITHEIRGLMEGMQSRSAAEVQAPSGAQYGPTPAA
uniref:Uncharacterized protein n=1 Tax=Paracidobacterium acidisoli TaxID=2303751 RepID=A0A372IIX9_9BACT